MATQRFFNMYPHEEVSTDFFVFIKSLETKVISFKGNNTYFRERKISCVNGREESSDQVPKLHIAGLSEAEPPINETE